MHGLTLNIIKSMQRTREWTTTDSGEILGLVALTIYMNVVKVPCVADCGSTACLFAHGMSQLFQTFITKICNLTIQAKTKHTSLQCQVSLAPLLHTLVHLLKKIKFSDLLNFEKEFGQESHLKIG